MPVSPVHALHIESGGNQRYIFASNKLREAVGASQLVLEAGTSLVIEAMQQSKVTPLPHSWDAAAVLRTALADAERSPRFERHQVEIQQLLSGRAVVLAGNRELAEAVGRAVTRAALLKAPGLDLACGIAGPARDDETLGDVLLAAAQDRNARAAHHAGAAVRFGRLPVVDECATTGLPASRWVTEKAFPRGAALSRVALAKRRAADRGIARMIALGTGGDPTEAQARRTLSQLEELLESPEGAMAWLGIVHVDGNGVGQQFLQLAQELQGADPRTYIDAFRARSHELDAAAEEAYREALAAVPEITPPGGEAFRPVVPLILGGDDLTVLVRGEDALRFTVAYQRALERTGKITSCAGVALTKPHFPFIEGYRLAAELADRTKDAMRRIGPRWTAANSALDWHVLYDASGPDLRRIRRELDAPSSVRLHGRPYVVSTEVTGEWADAHRFSDLEREVAEGLRAPAAADGGRRQLPRTQLHALRELASEPAAADAHLRRIAGRYPQAVQAAFGSSPSLYRTSPHLPGEDEDAPKRLTRIIDLMDADEFLVAR